MLLIALFLPSADRFLARALGCGPDMPGRPAAPLPPVPPLRRPSRLPSGAQGGEEGCPSRTREHRRDPGQLLADSDYACPETLARVLPGQHRGGSRPAGPAAADAAARGRLGLDGRGYGLQPLLGGRTGSGADQSSKFCSHSLLVSTRSTTSTVLLRFLVLIG
jgi:hypothetical protein